MPQRFTSSDLKFIREALRLAMKGYGFTSPNPMVGALLVRRGQIIGRGWHHRAGEPHAEIEAIRDAQKHGNNLMGATLYVTLEPCSTFGRTPPCTDAVKRAGVTRVVVATTDPNPNHSGKGLRLLRRAGIEVAGGIEAETATRLNEAFNHWIVHRTPLVTVKAAMTLDGKIATEAGESKWITGEKARAYGMHLRQGADAILAGINTILLDDPGLTFRSTNRKASSKKLRRIILDPGAKTPITARVVTDEFAAQTTIVVTDAAPAKAVAALGKKVTVVVAPARRGKIDLRWLLKLLGRQNVTNLLVEGGGETNALFLTQRLAQRVAFFYASKILCGRHARKAVAGDGITNFAEKVTLRDVDWTTLGEDLLLTARVAE